MATIRVKAKEGTAVARLVRYRYSKSAGRSATDYVGTVRRDADPDLLPAGIDLRPGMGLSKADVECVRSWLATDGDPVAIERRLQSRRQLVKDIKRQVIAEIDGLGVDGAVASVIRALGAAGTVFVEEAEAIRCRGGDVWQLRTQYLVAYKAIESFLECAKLAGVTRTVRQGSTMSSMNIEEPKT